jgi:NADPH:quinone reductase-like Zn-dependent oxidoreductase
VGGLAACGDGGAERLTIMEHCLPVPATDEAIAAVKSISLTTARSAASLRLWRCIDRWDFAGVIEAAFCGSAFLMGDRVVCLTFEGMLAKRVAVPSTFLALRPDEVSFNVIR